MDHAPCRGCVCEAVDALEPACRSRKASIDRCPDDNCLVHSWLKALRDDKSLVIKAAQQAQKAVDRTSRTDTEEAKAA